MFDLLIFHSNDWIVLINFILLFLIISFFIFGIGYHKIIPRKDSVLPFGFRSQNKGERWAQKIRSVYNNFLHHWRRQIHLCKLNVSCNFIHLRCCSQSANILIRPWTFCSWTPRFWSRCCDHIIAFFEQVGA